MNAYEKSIDLGLIGTDAEQVTILQSLTSLPISTSSLSNYLLTQGLMFIGRDGKVNGTLSAIVNSYLDLLAGVLYTDASSEIYSHTQDWGPNFSATIDSLLASGDITQEQSDAVFAIGGGRPYQSLTMIEFANQRNDAVNANEKQTALDGVYTKSTRANEAAEASWRAGDTPGQITAAGQAGWDGV